MRGGKSIVQLAEEVQRQAASKRDYVVAANALQVVPDPAAEIGHLPEPLLVVPGEDGGHFRIADSAHEQLADRLKIPKVYYDRLLAEDRGEFARHLTARLGNSNERRMVRTLNGRARAYLSDRYRRLDHMDLMEAILPPLVSDTSLQVMSSEVTDRRLYLKVVSHSIQAEVRKGEVVQAGLVISNSEIGQGAISIQILLYILACTNGAIMEGNGTRQYHVGRQVGEDGALESFYRDETLRADDQAFWMKVRDVVSGTLTEAKFQLAVERARQAAGDVMDGDPIKAVELLGDRMGLNEGERGGVLRHLLAGGDLTRWGLSNAVTRLSQDEKVVPAYDRATELETLGGRLLSLPPGEWNEIARAA
jgi:hypothetical protein